VSRRNWILAAVVGLLVVTCAVSASVLAQEPQSDDGGPDTAVDCEPCEWPGRGPEMHFRDRSGLVNVVAEVLGVDTDEVFAALEGGEHPRGVCRVTRRRRRGRGGCLCG